MVSSLLSGLFEGDECRVQVANSSNKHSALCVMASIASNTESTTLGYCRMEETACT